MANKATIKRRERRKRKALQERAAALPGWVMSVTVPTTPTFLFQEETEDNTMFNAEQNRIEYLSGRLTSIAMDKEDQLYKHFGLRDDDPPQTAKEIVDRILAGKFILPSDEKFKDYGWGPWRGLRWRDPNLVEDRPAFEKAREAMFKAQGDTEDIIQTLSPEEGLKALNDFKAMTFH